MADESNLSRFADEGYAVLRGVLDEADLAPVRAEYAGALRSRAQAWRARDRLRGGEDLVALPFEEHLIGLSLLEDFDPSLLAELDLTLPHMPFTFMRHLAHPERVQDGAADWRRQWEHARDLIVASCRPVPGRREFAQLVSDAIIKGWEAGDYLDLEGVLATG